jgi:hypothetical protein
MIRRFRPFMVGNKKNRAGNSFFLVSTPADLLWFGIAYSPTLGMWAAVADGGIDPVMTATDPEGTWTQQTATNVRWRDITWDPVNEKFCACSVSGTFRIMNSTDGFTWVNRSAATASTWFGIAYGNGYLVSCANARIQWSTNGGDTWTNVSTPAGDYRAVAYSPDLGMWAAVGNSGVIMTATDPTGTWTSRTADNPILGIDIQWEDGKFVASDFLSNINACIVSTDGITWTRYNGNNSFNRNTVVFGNGKWFTAGNNSFAAPPQGFEESSDAITWLNKMDKLENNGNYTIQRMRYADDKFVCVISSGSSVKRIIMSN